MCRSPARRLPSADIVIEIQKREPASGRGTQVTPESSEVQIVPLTATAASLVPSTVDAIEAQDRLSARCVQGPDLPVVRHRRMRWFEGGGGGQRHGVVVEMHVAVATCGRRLERWHVHVVFSCGCCSNGDGRRVRSKSDVPDLPDDLPDRPGPH